VEEIDKQHQLLMKYINELYDAMRAGEEKEALKRMIRRLSNYAGIHFAREEHYFEIFDYLDADSHIEEHNGFEKKVTAFENDFIEGKQSLSIEIMNFLSNWLISHIKGSDKRFGPFLNERGLK
jgi:hemerythrin